jgi:uncharacterized HAD superfamily protein
MTVGLDIDGVVANFITPAVVHFTQERKSALIQKLGIGLFADDRHEYCGDVATETDAVALMPHRPYNQAFNPPRVRRIDKFDQVCDHMK